MTQQVTFNMFSDKFVKFDRDNKFSFRGKKALFDHLESYEDETGDTIDLDIIALCCDYTEYESFKELQNDYRDIKSMEELEDETVVIKIEGSEGFIIANF